MDIQILPNGNLQLKADASDVEELMDYKDERNETTLMSDLLEPYSTNSSFSFFDAGDANPFVGLTSAPCIAESLSDPDDDGKMEEEGRLWWFPDYAVRSIVDELIETGEVVFQAAPGYEATPEPTAESRKRPSPGR